MNVRVRGTLMATDEWERTKDARIHLSRAFSQAEWGALTNERRDEAVRREANQANAGFNYITAKGKA